MILSALFLMSIYGVDAAYICTSATRCNVTCDNFVPKGYDIPNGSVVTVQPPWVVVPVEDGSCYFYNSVTDENQNDYPDTNKDDMPTRVPVIRTNTRLRGNVMMYKVAPPDE